MRPLEVIAPLHEGPTLLADSIGDVEEANVLLTPLEQAVLIATPHADVALPGDGGCAFTINTLHGAQVGLRTLPGHS